MNSLVAAAHNPTTTTAFNREGMVREWLACRQSAPYFVHHYCWIEDAVIGQWVPFHLWPAQAEALRTLQQSLLNIWLKARQIGMTWLALAYALWKLIFHPIATVLLFSRRDDEAVELLNHRLKGMYQRLPSWMQARGVVVDNTHDWALSTGARAKAFPTNAGDSYTATLVIADEFDLVPDQDQLLRAVKPTIDNGGQMVLLSRPDKDRPDTRFKRIYKAARQQRNGWSAIFLPWDVHPGRDAAWYETQRADIQSSTGSLDDLYEQYPATEDEALAARSLNKRIPPAWLPQCYAALDPLFVVGIQDPTDPPRGLPAVPGLEVFRLPHPDGRYVMGADPAEGLPSSDDSALSVLDAATGEEVAKWSGKYEPKLTFPKSIDAIGRWYNGAPVLVERNNHGHAVIGYLQNNTRTRVLVGYDGRPGWNNNEQGRVRLFDDGAAVLMTGSTRVHSLKTKLQLGSIEKDTLSAPLGEHDDDAYSYLLGLKALAAPQKSWEAV